MLGAALVGNGRGHVQHQVLVPCRGEADGLREDGRFACAGNAVQGFVPPIVLADAEPFDGRGLVVHLRGLLLEGQTADQIGGAGLGAQRGVPERIFVGHGFDEIGSWRGVRRRQGGRSRAGSKPNRQRGDTRCFPVLFHGFVGEHHHARLLQRPGVDVRDSALFCSLLHANIIRAKPFLAKCATRDANRSGSRNRRQGRARLWLFQDALAAFAKKYHADDKDQTGPGQAMFCCIHENRT